MCDLKTSQVNVRHCIIKEVMVYELELSHNAAEKNPNSYCAKDEGAVDHNTATRWLKKFRLICKNLYNQARSGRRGFQGRTKQ